MILRPNQHTAPANRADPAAVLSKAVLRASPLLGLTNAALASVLGVSEASVSRLASGQRQIDPDSKEGERALLLVRAYRSLDALVGSEESARLAWMASHNRALNGRPVDLVARAEGLSHVVSYLDAMRAPA